MSYPPRPVIARAVAGSLVLGLGIGSALLCSAAPAAAAAPRAQAVGRFVDGAVGGNPIQQVADLKDARATNPGTVSDQNPLDVTVGGRLDIPLSGKLQAPGGNVFHVGVANQIARARSNGYALGAAGAVADSGGASLGGNSNAYPSNATLDLSAAGLPSAPIPLPGGNKASLGGLTASIGAVSAKAHTPPGVGAPGDTQYNIAGLKLTLSSPALAGVLAQLADALKAPSLPSSPLPAPGLPSQCSFKTQFLSPATVGGGALSIDPTTGAITLDVAAALRALGTDINSLPANTDLLAYVLKYLSSADGLSAGLQNVIGNTFATQKQNFADCLVAFGKAFPPPLAALVQTALKTITAGQTQLTDAINGAVKQLTSAGGSNPLAPITDGLKQAVQIGVNVQPNGPSGSYRSPLRATPDQATPVVAGQTVVRALEIDLGGGSGVSLALANAAAGPSSAAPVVTHPTPAPVTTAPVRHNHVLPTGVPAGQGPIGGGPSGLPLTLLGVGVVLAGAGALAWRLRSGSH
jgi:hypothetical protein